jgi:hypothetical protein
MRTDAYWRRITARYDGQSEIQMDTLVELYAYVMSTDFRETLCLIHIDAAVDHRDPVAESDAITARSSNDVIIRGPFLGGGHTQKSLHATRGGCLRFHSACRDLTPTPVAETQWKHAKCWANGLRTPELPNLLTTPLKAADTRVV